MRAPAIKNPSKRITIIADNSQNEWVHSDHQRSVSAGCIECTRRRCQTLSSRRVHWLTFSRLAQQWISEFHSVLSPVRVGSRLRSINYFVIYIASLVHSAELMNVEPSAVLGFLSFSIVLLKFHLRRWPIHNTFSLKRSRAICMLNAVFTFVSSVDAVRTHDNRIWTEIFCSGSERRGFRPKKLDTPSSQMVSGLSRSGHRPLAIYENRENSAVLFERLRSQIFMRRVVEPAAVVGKGDGMHRRGVRRVLNEKL